MLSGVFATGSAFTDSGSAGSAFAGSDSLASVLLACGSSGSFGSKATQMTAKRVTSRIIKMFLRVFIFRLLRKVVNKAIYTQYKIPPIK